MLRNLCAMAGGERCGLFEAGESTDKVARQARPLPASCPAPRNARTCAVAVRDTIETPPATAFFAATAAREAGIKAGA